MRVRVYSIQKVLSLKEKIQTAPGVTYFLGQQIEGEVLDEFVTAVHGCLPGSTVWGTVFDSLECLAGTELTEEALYEVAWRFAGNLPRLRLHRAAGPWCRQEVDEIVPVQVVAVHFGYTTFKKFGGTFELQILAGTSASMLVEKFWTKGYCQMLKSMFGFSAPWGKHPFADIRQFVGLRFSVRIAAAMSGSRPDFEKIWQEQDKIKPPSLFEWNRQLMRQRNRVGFRCPKNYPLDRVKCHLCAIGEEECPVATHELSYEQRECEGCNKTEWFDPAGPQQDLCIRCHQRNLKEDA